MQVLVIGAGVVGLAVARAAARKGHEVVVAEAANAIGTGISSRNSEVIHGGMYYPTGTLRGAPLRARPAHAVRILRLARRAAPQMRQADRRHQRGRARQDRGDREARRHQRRRRPGADRRQCGARAWSRSSSASARCIRRRPASSTATLTCWRCAAISRIAGGAIAFNTPVIGRAAQRRAVAGALRRQRWRRIRLRRGGQLRRARRARRGARHRRLSGGARAAAGAGARATTSPTPAGRCSRG